MTTPTGFRKLSLGGLLAAAFAILVIPAFSDDALHLGILDYPRFQAEETQVIAFIRSKQLDKAEALLRSMSKRYPKSPTTHYNLACVLSLKGKIDESFALLDRSLEVGFRKPDHIKQDPDLINLRKDARFKKVLEEAAQPLNGPTWPQFAKAAVASGKDGAVLLTESNLGYSRKNGMFMGLIRVADGLAEKPVTTLDDKVGKLLGKWYEAGSAAGNAGDLYDNHDNAHSNMNFRAYPQLTSIQFGPKIRERNLHHGLQRHFVYSGITLGNSSTALTHGIYWRSQVRGALTQPNGAARLALHYVGNHFYFYPEHRDHDVGLNGKNGGGYGDVFPANVPYVVISQGSSGSDRAFMNAFAATLAAFRPEVKKKLAVNGFLGPSMQMIFRRSNSHLETAQDYFTGKAHPTVFDSKNLDVVRMIRRAHAIKEQSLPPFAQFKAMHEDQPVPARDFFDFRPHQKLFDTPCAVARVYKTTAPTHSITLDAQGSRDLAGKELTYRWVVLRGKEDEIKIDKLDEDGSVVEITVPWHHRRPVLPGSALESNRVDVGLFVGNGEHWSAPAIYSVYFPANQKRVFDENGRLSSIDYGQDHYVDPFIDNVRNWRDEYRYDDKGKLLGWTRFHKEEEPQLFTPEGLLVLESAQDGTPIRTVPVRYLPKKLPDERVSVVQSPPR